MKTLVWPDVHHRTQTLKTVLKNLGEGFDKRIFLGDWFDNWNDTPQHARNAAECVKELLCDPRNVFIEGNHDTAYRYNHPSYFINGCTLEKWKAINSVLNRFDWDRFKLYEIQDGFVCSHAGMCKEVFSHPIEGVTYVYLEEQCQRAVEAMRSHIIHPVYYDGTDNGGKQPYSGITWLRWGKFRPLSGINQIVGHTILDKSEVRYGRIKVSRHNGKETVVQENVKVTCEHFENNPPKPGSLCSLNFNIDTDNREFLILENGVVTRHLTLDYL